jgi:hypothetical protein
MAIDQDQPEIFDQILGDLGLGLDLGFGTKWWNY